MSEGAAPEVAVRLKAFADLCDFGCSRCSSPASEAVCTCAPAPAVRLTEATVSHHLGRVGKAGCISGERRGMNLQHSAHRDVLGAMAQVIEPASC